VRNGEHLQRKSILVRAGYVFTRAVANRGSALSVHFAALLFANPQLAVLKALRKLLRWAIAMATLLACELRLFFLKLVRRASNRVPWLSRFQVTERIDVGIVERCKNSHFGTVGPRLLLLERLGKYLDDYLVDLMMKTFRRQFIGGDRDLLLASTLPA